LRAISLRSLTKQPSLFFLFAQSIDLEKNMSNLHTLIDLPVELRAQVLSCLRRPRDLYNCALAGPSLAIESPVDWFVRKGRRLAVDVVLEQKAPLDVVKRVAHLAPETVGPDAIVCAVAGGRLDVVQWFCERIDADAGAHSLDCLGTCL
jgi:hypothetical protein